MLRERSRSGFAHRPLRRAVVGALRRGREASRGDERIRGSAGFVEPLRRGIATAERSKSRLTSVRG